jgi:hypothetical protein
MRNEKVVKSSGSRWGASIKLVLFGALAALGLLVLVMLVVGGTRSWSSYSSAVSQQEFDSGANRFISGLFEILLERLATNNTLQAADAAGAPVLA